MKLYELALHPSVVAGITNYKSLVCEHFRIPPESIGTVRLAKRAIDARGRQVKIRVWLEVYGAGETLPAKRPDPDYKMVHQCRPVLIAGCGPAGLFAALRLLEHGLKPVIIEQGKDVRSRRRDLALINRTGMVNPFSNYCFGEGGAGTYSDGKLYTRSTKRGDISSILNAFVSHGANEDILVEAHPHIGTNKLPQVIASMHETICNYGGEIHFNRVLEEIVWKNGSLEGIYTRLASNAEGQPEFWDGKALILATGHSSRNVFEMLHQQKIKIEAKPYAIGVRTEHAQNIIDAQQYHCQTRLPALPPASYSLTYQGAEKSLYSFCMCPGGIIAPAATGPEEVVVNGWSPSKRNNPFANSGMVVNIGPDDLKEYASSGPLAGLRFQQDLEKMAFESAGGGLKAPAQRLVDFTEEKFSTSLPACSYVPGIVPVSLDELLPPVVSRTLREGLVYFGKKMKGYYTNEAVLVGVESRTSSPVRIPRNPLTLMHPEVTGLFPCGEGAGYAGGIVSAGIDGQRCADHCTSYLADLY